jgi:hypothetical protein
VQGSGLGANIRQHAAAFRQPLPAQFIHLGRKLARPIRNPAHGRRAEGCTDILRGRTAYAAGPCEIRTMLYGAQSARDVTPLQGSQRGTRLHRNLRTAAQAGTWIQGRVI